MPSTNQDHAPIYILKWRLKRSERGRKHMAVFIPNPQYRNVNPTDLSQRCLGTMIHVQGSPLAGFQLNFKRNWDRQRTQNVESAHFLSWVKAEYAPEPPTKDFVTDDTRPNGLLDQIAMTVRPPGVSQPLWDAEAIFDCQDWVHDYIDRLSQRRVVDAAAVNTLSPLLDTKTALMAHPDAASSASQPITASTAGPAQLPTQSSTSVRSGRGRYTNSEWDGARKVFRRYDNVEKKWEYRDSSGAWRLMT